MHARSTAQLSTEIRKLANTERMLSTNLDASYRSRAMIDDEWRFILGHNSANFGKSRQRPSTLSPAHHDGRDSMHYSSIAGSRLDEDVPNCSFLGMTGEERALPERLHQNCAHNELVLEQHSNRHRVLESLYCTLQQMHAGLATNRASRNDLRRGGRATSHNSQEMSPPTGALVSQSADAYNSTSAYEAPIVIDQDEQYFDHPEVQTYDNMQLTLGDSIAATSSRNMLQLSVPDSPSPTGENENPQTRNISNTQGISSQHSVINQCDTDVEGNSDAIAAILLTLQDTGRAIDSLSQSTVSNIPSAAQNVIVPENSLSCEPNITDSKAPDISEAVALETQADEERNIDASAPNDLVIFTCRSLEPSATEIQMVSTSDIPPRACGTDAHMDQASTDIAIGSPSKNTSSLVSECPSLQDTYLYMRRNEQDQLVAEGLVSVPLSHFRCTRVHPQRLSLRKCLHAEDPCVAGVVHDCHVKRVLADIHLTVKAPKRGG